MLEGIALEPALGRGLGDLKQCGGPHVGGYWSDSTTPYRGETLHSDGRNPDPKLSYPVQNGSVQNGDNPRNPAMFNTGYNGLLGLLILIGDVWAIINIFQSSASNGKKLLWTLLVLLLPLLGLIIWFFLGPRGGKT